MLNLGLIGLGYWGPNLARVLNQTQRCKFVACSDLQPQRLEKITRQYPGIQGFNNLADMWEKVDAVCIATPISTHFDLAYEALSRGKHVFVEKPLAHSFAHAQKLVDLAKRKNLTLMTGHTFLYSPPVIRVKELIQSGVLGALNYLSFSRVNLGLYQKDVDVLWDLAVHDISILLYWLGETPNQGTSFGRACVQRDKNDVAFIWLQFPSGVIASIEISWLSPQKMRRTCVAGTQRMVVYDDTEPNEKLKIYDRGVEFTAPQNFGEFQLTYRTGDIVSPHLGNSEPLLTEMEQFIDCCETGAVPRSSGEFGANVVRVLEMVTENRTQFSAATPEMMVGSTR
jgi:predicted dehydrogenase